MDKLFGTDGIRAVAGHFPLDYSSVHTLGSALIDLLGRKGFPSRVLIGCDTRESGVWLEKALAQGIRECDGEPTSAGIIPTSAISFLTKKHTFSAGIVISASHNPFQDNGIKIFSAEGTKIPERWEAELEEAINHSGKKVQPKDISITAEPSLREEYLEYMQGRFSLEHASRKIKVVVDCANGASSFFAPEILTGLGFEVFTINNNPDGKNINANCGSLYPELLAKKVMENQADLGVAYDGDADRALWVDEKGHILNGDHTLYVLSKYMQERGALKSRTIVATIMSNLGLEMTLKRLGLKLLRTQVGDKYVLEQMLKSESNLGGEQSGHTILLDDCPTGDGILTSIKMLEVMASSGMPLSELVADFDEFPQVLKNVPVSRKEDFQNFPEIVKTIEEVNDLLGESGRMNVRYSGTEPLARVMIEGQDQEQIESYASQISNVITKYLGN
jgi:phosphoglucosamine mutase